jgi:hypothetical protein
MTDMIRAVDDTISSPFSFAQMNRSVSMRESLVDANRKKGRLIESPFRK